MLSTQCKDGTHDENTRLGASYIQLIQIAVGNANKKSVLVYCAAYDCSYRADGIVYTKFYPLG